MMKTLKLQKMIIAYNLNGLLCKFMSIVNFASISTNKKQPYGAMILKEKQKKEGEKKTKNPFLYLFTSALMNHQGLMHAFCEVVQR